MTTDLESRIQETGKQLYGLLEGESPSVFRKKYWTDKITEWCMHDEVFKLEMFRFIDVLPSLSSSEAIAIHLREYFSRPGLKLPSGLQQSIRLLSPGWIPTRMIARTVASNIASFARQYIAGATPEEALPVLEKIRSQGMAFTVDLLGESVISEAEADGYLQRYLGLFDILDEAKQHWPALGGALMEMDWGHAPKVNVSIKTSALYSQMNPCAFEYSIDRAKERLRPIFRRAIQTGAFVSLDMEQRSTKNLTLALYRSLMEEPEFRHYPHTGIVLQAYLKESEADLEEMIAWARRQSTQITIRLVKGAYWDSEVIWAQQRNWPVPVFSRKLETDAGYEELATRIMTHHDRITLACASHNIRTIAYVIEKAKDMKVPLWRLEYQVLYGMGEQVRSALRKAGLPLRLYTPVGEMIQGMAYLVRRLMENTANESFLRLSFTEGAPVEELLKNPAVRLEAQSPLQPGPLPAQDAPALEAAALSPFQNEPLLDWTSAEHRLRFREALEQVRSSFPGKVPLAIDGLKIWKEGAIVSTNPNDPDESVAIVSSAGPQEADEAIRAARAAFHTWRSTSAEARAGYLFRAAEAARRSRYELAALQVFEVGKSWSEADGDVCEAIDFLEYYGREMIRLGKPRRMGRAPGESSVLFYEPRGVAVVIAPWNFPLAISTGMTSAAIVTGNTVVYKPASQSPAVGWMMYRLFEVAGLPRGVLNYLPGPGSEVGNTLVKHPSVALIAFTGSKGVGLHIIESASRLAEGAMAVKSVIAEMGGKNAIIVDDDADLDEAVVHIIQSAFGYQGQKCSACSRLIATAGIYDRLVERLVAAAQSMELGPPEDPKNFMGAVIEAAARRKVLEYLEIGKKEGRLLIERHPPDPRGHSVPLAIFDSMSPESRMAQEEIFGPVLSIIKAHDFEEAIQVANDSQYALTGGVFSRSPGNIDKARREFRTGSLYINRGCTGAIVGRHPFGGFKLSGVGSKAGGPDYLLQFMIPRNVVENTIRRGFAPSEGE